MKAGLNLYHSQQFNDLNFVVLRLESLFVVR